MSDQDKHDIIGKGGHTYYYKKGTNILHREDGPAVEQLDGFRYWYLNGECLTEEEFDERMKYDIVKKDKVTIYYKKGTKTFHCEEGPALIFKNGSKLWCLDGEKLTEEEFNERMKYDIKKTASGHTVFYKKGTDIKHCEDGPAVILSDGSTAWYKDDLQHREDGPSVELSNGVKYWHLDGISLTEEEFNERMKYDIIKEYDGTYYYKKGTYTLHREDGPAVIEDNYKAWYINGKSHREDGPAFEYANGEKSWYLNGDQLTEEEFNEKMGMNIKDAVKASETLGDIDISDHLNKQVGGDHYKKQSIQPWDYMEATMPEEQFIGYLRGNVIKYVSRYDKKGGIQDIDKALHYLEKLRSCL